MLDKKLIYIDYRGIEHADDAALISIQKDIDFCIKKFPNKFINTIIYYITVIYLNIQYKKYKNSIKNLITEEEINKQTEKYLQKINNFEDKVDFEARKENLYNFVLN